MINFEEELKKFHPSLEIDEAEDVIINHNMTDFTDILVDMVKEQEKQGKRLETLEDRDGAMWRKVVAYGATALVGIFIGYIAQQLGLK